MLSKRFLWFLSVLIYLCGINAAPQLTTVLPIGVADSVSDATNAGVISGAIIGTGPDGTTYVLTPAATGVGAIPITATIVENASGFTAEFAASSGDFVQTQSVACGLSVGSAQCTEELIGASASQTASTVLTTSGVPAVATIVVLTSSVPASTSSAAPASTQSQSSSAGRSYFIDGLLSVLTTLLMIVVMHTI